MITQLCDHFVAMQTSYGRPDPKRTAFATGEPWSALVGPTMLHSVPFCALALYEAGRKFQREDYIGAAGMTDASASLWGPG